MGPISVMSQHENSMPTVTPAPASNPGASASASGENASSGGWFSGMCPSLSEKVGAVKADITKEVTAAVLNASGNHKTAIMNALKAYEDSWENCHSRAATANTMCLESCSPHIQTGATAINGLAAAGRGVGGTSAQCGSAAAIFDIVQGALSAFQGACGAAKAHCHGSCDTGLKALATLKTKLAEYDRALTPVIAQLPTYCAEGQPTTKPLDAQFNNVVSLAQNWTCAGKEIIGQNMTTGKSAAERAKLAIEKELQASTNTSIAAREKVCAGYTTQLLTAGGSIASMLALRKQAKDCETQTAAVPNESCDIEENKSKTKCICEANPRTVGCPNSLDKSNMISGTPQIDGISAISPTTAGTGGNVGGDGSAQTSGAERFGSGVDGASGGLGGGGGIGAPAGGGGGSGSSGNTAAAAAAYQRRMSANVLSTDSGGGGGGWGSGSSGSNGNASGLRRYLPGGSRDPAAAAGAAANDISNQITGAAGRSNFEKVSERYQDNRSTLITNK